MHQSFYTNVTNLPNAKIWREKRLESLKLQLLKSDIKDIEILSTDFPLYEDMSLANISSEYIYRKEYICEFGFTGSGIDAGSKAQSFNDTPTVGTWCADAPPQWFQISYRFPPQAWILLFI